MEISALICHDREFKTEFKYYFGGVKAWSGSKFLLNLQKISIFPHQLWRTRTTDVKGTSLDSKMYVCWQNWPHSHNSQGHSCFMWTFCYVVVEDMPVSEKTGPCWTLGFLLFLYPPFPLPFPCVLSELVIKQSYPHIVPKESWPPSWTSKPNPTH